MKNLMIIIAAFFAISANAQDKLSTFKAEAVSTKTYEVLASQSDGETSVWVDFESLDGIASFPMIKIDEADWAWWTSTMETVMTKYEEWKKVATENNVTELNKVIPTQRHSITGMFQYGNDLYFDFSTNLTFKFQVIEGYYVIVINTGEMVSSSNEFITCDAAILGFKDANELKAFNEAVSMDKAKEMLEGPQVADLFN